MKRKSGVLLPITALMSEYGIGDFGQSAYSFMDFLVGMGFSIWQILPITILGAGNSPYSGVSAFAGNFLLIDPESIPSNLLSQDEKNSFKYNGSPYKVDYEFARNQKKNLLNLAYSRLNEEQIYEISSFAKKNAYWIEDYSLFMALIEKHGYDFLEWDESIKLRRKTAIKNAIIELGDRINYYKFEQYIFYTQWEKLKEVARARGITIFGDMPIYLAHQSVDVWSNPSIFELEDNLTPKRVAGVPPDYFSDEGQLWGNPLYRYKKMEKDNFQWWRARIKHNLELYDLVRIDHFRGLYKYWAIPATSTSAKNGEWVDGPQYKFWDVLREEIDELNIVAEDLGIIDDDVKKYLEELKFPGMRVFQFGFDGKSDNPHLPYNHEKNVVAYTATHDNNTTLGWLYYLNQETRERVLLYLESENSEWGAGGGTSPAVRAAVKEIISSVANIAIIPFQDLCGYGADTRINIPGTPTGNWEFRTTFAAFDEINTSHILRLNRLYGRTER
ncbi:MAG: 4-alpha-glucanotransferase [Christensenellaceae bacterium]|jgi:4-alpha-glucanotransferase|nr:4-alpha-glucanotransferase [Christensenellaceae bacterium]